MGARVVFVGPGVDDADRLLAVLPASTSVVRLDAATDALGQIRAELAGRRGLEAIEILAHGAPGRVLLGNGELTQDAVNDTARGCAGWRASLAADAAIVIYSCEVAAGAAGAALLEALQQITGTRVLASSRRLGAGQGFEPDAGGFRPSLHIERCAHALADIPGGAGNDSLAGTTAADTLTGAAGNDTLEGSGGADRAVFSGNSGDYRLGWTADGYLSVTDTNTADGDDGTDYLRHVEALRFADRLVDVTLAGETRVNTTTANAQLAPAVAVLDSGSYVVVWSSYAQDGSGYGIYAQRYSAAGVAAGEEFRINSATTNDQSEPAIAALEGGGFVVVWSSYAQDGSYSGVYAQRYSASGTAVGAEFRINTTVTDAQSAPSVAGLAGGGFVVGWASANDGSGWGAYTQRFDAAGAPLGPELRVNTYTVSTQWEVDLAGTADGGYVVAWSSNGQDGSGAGVYMRRFNVNGLSLTGDVQVNVTTIDYQSDPSVGVLADGTVVVAWVSYAQDGSVEGIFARRFAADGSALGGEIRVNSYSTSYQNAPAVSALADGGFAIAWSSYGQDGSGYGVYAQRFDAGGVAVGGEFRVSTTTPYDQGSAAVAGLGAGGFVVAWASVYQEGDNWGVFAQRFDADGTVQLTQLAGTGGADRLDLSGGGALAAAGGAGDDLYLVDNSADRVIESATGGLDSVQSSASYALPGGVENLLLTGSAALEGSGNALANSLVGNAGDNRLAGLGGNDTLDGAAGNDTVTYAAAGAAITLDLAVAAPQDTGGAGIDQLASIEHAIGSAFADTLRGSAAANRLEGLAGDDSLAGGAGNDTLDGGAGIDRVEFAGPMEDYRFGWSNGQLTVQDLDPADGDEGTDFLRSIERLVFADGEHVLAPGGELRVNSYTAGDQTQPAMTQLRNGGSVVAWQSQAQDGSGWGVVVQRYDSAGIAIGGEILATTHRADDQTQVQLAALDGGGYVVVWQSNAQDGSASGIYAQRFSAAGARQGSEFLVNSTTALAQSGATVTALADGGFVVAWESQSQDGSAYGVYLQRFAANGSRVGSETQVATTILYDQYAPSVTALADGGYLVAWQSQYNDGSSFGIYAQRYRADGSARGAEFLVNTTTVSDQVAPVTAALEGGGFVVVWASYGTDGSSYGIYAQRYAAGGAAVGGEFRVNTYTGSDQNAPAVTALAGGGFAVAWHSYYQDGSGYSVHAQRYDATGAPQGGEIRVSTTVDYDQSNPVLLATADGGFTVSWQSQLQDGSGYSIQQQHVGPDGLLVLQRIEGTAGNDRIDIGGAGGLHAIGGTGDDTYVVDGLDDRVTEVAGEGTDTVEAGIGWTLGDALENLVLTGTAALDGTGNALANAITGNSGANRLDGGAGNDTLDGGAGSDTVLYDAATAAVGVDLGAGTATGGGGADSLHDIEHVIGSIYADALTGSTAANLLVGGRSADTLRGAAGNDTLDGGLGVDTAVFAGTAGDYRLGWSSNGQLTVTDLNAADGDDGIDMLTGIETLVFADRSFTVTPGGEVRVNTQVAGDQSDPSVAVLASGGRVVTWTSYAQDGSAEGVYAQRYSAAGAPLGEEFRVNDTTASTQYQPAIAALDDGGFLVTWSSLGEDGSGYGVYARRYDAAGATVGDVFRVNGTTASDQYEPAIAVLPSGEFVITWSAFQDGSGLGIVGRRFAADGTALGDEFAINTTTVNYQSYSAVSALAGGGFLVTWMSQYQDGSGYGIYGRIYSAAGVAGAEFVVNEFTTGNQIGAASAALPDGGFIVSWTSDSQDADGSYGVYAQRFAADGSRAGAEFRVNTVIDSTQDQPAVLALADGGVVIAWRSFVLDGSGYTVLAQRFDADGNRVGGEFALNTTSAGTQELPALAALPDGGFEAVWQSYAQDGSSYGVYAQRFDANGQPVLLRINGTAGDDRIDLGGAIPLAGNGGAGNDVYVVDDAADRPIEAAGGGTDTVESSIGWTLGAALEQLVLTGTAALAGGGNELANRLTGNAGNNTLEGFAGNDTLDGGTGSDTASWAGAAAAVAVDLSLAGAQASGGASSGTDTLIGIENLAGSAFADTLAGDAGANLLAGNAGNDLLTGGAGNDTLEGGLNNDVAVFDGNAADYRLGWSGGYVTVQDLRAGGGSGIDQLRGIETLRFADGDRSLAAGGEIRINSTTTGAQEYADIATLANGSQVVVWQSEGQDGSGSGVYAQRINAAGVPVGEEFRVNSATIGAQASARVAALADGSFVVTWLSYNQDDAGWGVFGQRYAANGTALGGEFHVNTTTAYDQAGADVAALAGGGFVVVWDSNTQDGSLRGVYQQRYDASGNPLGAETRVNTTTVDTQADARITAFADGSYVVVWQSWYQDSNSWGVYGQRYSAAGDALGTEFQVNTTTGGDQSQPRAVEVAGGGFVVIWHAQNQDGSGFGIFMQRFDADGVKQGGELQVNTTTFSDQIYPNAVQLAGGGFVVTWTSWSQDGSAWTVVGRVFDADGTPAGAEFRVNTYTTSDQYWPSVSALDDGGFVVSWQSWLQDGSSYGIYSQRFNAAGLAVLPRIAGTAGADTIDLGGAGNLEGAGGAGDDVYVVDGPGDRIVEAADGGFDEVQSLASLTLGANLERLRLIGSAPIAGTGNAQANEIIGNESANTLDGGGGDDAITGRGGVDVAVYGGNATDYLIQRDHITKAISIIDNNPLDGDDGSDLLRSVEILRFADGDVSIVGEFDINSTTIGAQTDAAIARLGDGYVVAWQSGDAGGNGIFLQRYTATGGRLGDEVRVNTATGNDQLDPAVVTLSGGGFVVVWQSAGQDGSGTGIYAQRYDADGVAQGAEFRVNATVTDAQAAPAIAALSTGGFVVSWQSNLQDGSSYGIYAQRYDAGGNAVGGEILVNTTTANAQLAPTVSANGNGGFVVAWESAGGQDGSGYGVFAQRFDGNGAKTGGEIAINASTDGEQRAPVVTTLVGGGFVVAWVSTDGDGTGVYARRYDASGNALGSGEFRVNTVTALDQGDPSITALTGGGFVVSWTSTGQDGSSTSVHFQRYDGNGTALGTEQRANTTTLNAQNGSALAGIAGGGFVIGWQSNGQDQSGYGIFAKRYDGFGNPQSEPLFGTNGDDVLDLTIGDVAAYGLRGDDLYIVDSAGDLTFESADEGADTVLANLSWTLADNLENLVLGGVASTDGTGNTLDNALLGNGGANALAGADGADTLDGGAGADELAGGDGADVYYVDDAGDTVIEAAAQTLGGPAGQGNGPRAIGDSIDTVIAQIGYTLGANVENLTLAEEAGDLAGNGNELDNVVIGNDGDNLLAGFAGNDTAEGGAGNDTLDGGSGTDTLRGGLDDDTFIVDGGETVVEAEGEGTDSVQSSIQWTLGNYLERLVLTGTAAINGYGNDAANELTGNSAANRLEGAAGSDTLDGGAGADTLVGGGGEDRYRVDAGDVIIEGATVGIDTVESAFGRTLEANVENLVLTGAGDSAGTGNADPNAITGNAGANALSGDTGADTLQGGLGNDTLTGGAGADVLDGGVGDDTYVADAGDALQEGPDGGNDTVQTNAGWTLGEQFENLVLTGGAAVAGTGNALANALTGNAGANTLDGGGGADTLAGGDGNDSYLVDAGDVVQEAAGRGRDTVQSGASWTLGANLEILVLTGAVDANASGTGNDAANTLSGAGGNNLLDGGAGADSLAGGAGDDTLVGSAGLDTFAGGAGDDTYRIEAGESVLENAGEGQDTVEIDASLTLGAGIEHLLLTGSGLADGTGNELNNRLAGNSVRNVLTGLGGSDTLDGGAGGDDLRGGASGDLLLGGLGGDLLDGGVGADTLEGGAGDDVYRVDNAGDRLSELAGDGSDRVQSTLSFTLGTAFEHLDLTGLDAIDGTGNAAANRITGNAAANALAGAAGADTLDGGAGNDTLDGGTGNDTLAGGAGDDRYLVDAGDTFAEAADAGIDTLVAGFSVTLGANLENLELTGSAGLSGIGNGLVNLLLGNAGDDTLGGLGGRDTLQGGGGADALNGGTGVDSMAGGAGDDVYTVTTRDRLQENTDEGIDTVRSTVSWTLGANLENLVLTGSASIAGSGNGLANAITGTGGDNALSGAGGSDTLLGGLGNDTLTGGPDADQLRGGGGDDLYIVGSGDAITEIAGAGSDSVQSAASWVLSANLENLELTGTLSARGTGNVLANSIAGNTGANRLSGLTGADTLAGGEGADTLLGGDDGDVLAGGAGADRLSGGDGADFFEFGQAPEAGGIDVITDFVGGSDRIRLDDDAFRAFDAGLSARIADSQFISGAGLSTAQDADDYLIYDTANGALYYDADGSGTAFAAVRFATLGTNVHPELVAADFRLMG